MHIIISLALMYNHMYYVINMVIVVATFCSTYTIYWILW